MASEAKAMAASEFMAASIAYAPITDSIPRIVAGGALDERLREALPARKKLNQ